MNQPTPTIAIESFENDLATILKLKTPNLTVSESEFEQLGYLDRYLRSAEINCQSVIIEFPYIDRDYIEDYSAFYARSFFEYKNYCTRIHFFSSSVEDLQHNFTEIVHFGCSGNKTSYQETCRTINHSYLGFSIIKPLRGSPVGRTVIKHYKEQASQGLIRNFECTRRYTVNLLGAELEVKGLAFQQQDIGVSACATTAIWCALHKTIDFEKISFASPAQITTLASQYSLPLGRSMPSGGLTLDQMCQAMRALGVSPHVLKLDDFQTARGYLYSASMSGFASILVLRGKAKRSQMHAVTVAGIKVDAIHNPVVILPRIDDQSSDLKYLYVHDDRRGPYLLAELVEGTEEQFPTELKMTTTEGSITETDHWILTHMLIPMYPKIRLSFAEIRNISKIFTSYLRSITIEVLGEQGSISKLKDSLPIRFENRILYSQQYIKMLFFPENTDEGLSEERMRTFYRKIRLPRYVGIIRLSWPQIGEWDILIDTTSTPSHINCLGIISRNGKSEYTEMLTNEFSKRFECDSL